MNRKRKTENESDLEMTKPCKRFKLEEIILGNVSEEDENKNALTDRKIDKRRRKLLTAMHLKKKYKYYCKKHDVSYLIETARKTAKVFSKENRHNLVQSFRTLNVSNDQLSHCLQRESEDNNLTNTAKNRNLSKDQLNFENNDFSNNNKISVTKPQSPVNTTMEKMLVDNDLGDHDSGLSDDCHKILYTQSSPRDFSAIEKPCSFCDDCSSDSDNYNEETRFKKPKVVKCFIVKKNPENGNFIFSEGEDYIESDYDDEDIDCDCRYHENLKQKFFNYAYYSSSSSDDDL